MIEIIIVTSIIIGILFIVVLVIEIISWIQLTNIQSQIGPINDITNIYVSSCAIVTPPSVTDTSIVRWKGTNGLELDESGILIDSLNNISGVNDLSANGNIIGNSIQSGTHILSEKISKPLTSNFNSIARFNANDGSSVTDTNILIDNLDNVSGVNNITISNGLLFPNGGNSLYNKYEIGQVLNAEFQSISNPLDTLTVNLNYLVSGDSVILSIPQLLFLTLNSSTTAFSLVGAIPLEIRPNANIEQPVKVNINGIDSVGHIKIETTGDITFYGNIAGTANFNSGTDAILYGFFVPYLL